MRLVEIAGGITDTSKIIKFTKKMENIKTPMQLDQFFTSKAMIMKKAKVIPVQPTSRIRRKRRADFSCGKKRIQSGRPSNIETKLRIAKRKHSLATNVKENLPNAKSH